MPQPRTKELREKRGKLVHQMRKIVDTAFAEDRGLSAGEDETYKRIHDEDVALKRQIDHLDDLGSREAEMAGVVPSPLDGIDTFASTPAPSANGGFCFRDLKTGKQIRALTARERVSDLDREDREDREQVGADVVGRGIYALLTNRFDVLSADERRAMLGSSDTAGGYVLTPSVGAQIVDLARSASVAMAAGAQTLRMPTREMTIAKIASDPTSYWRAEGQAVTSADAALASVTLQAKTLAAIVPVSIELLEDAPNVAAILQQTLQKSLGQKLDEAILTGVGAENEPLGIRNHTGVNAATGVGTPTDWSDITAAVSAILADNYAGELSGLAWVAHPRDGATYDGLQDTANQPLQLTPWAAALRRFYTTAMPSTEGGGSNESAGIVGDFSQVLVGMRTSGIVIRILDSGTATDADSNTVNAASQLMRFVVAYMRADVALLQPTHFCVMSGITA